MTAELKTLGTQKSSIIPTMPHKHPAFGRIALGFWVLWERRIRVLARCGKGVWPPRLLQQHFPGFQAGPATFSVPSPLSLLCHCHWFLRNLPWDLQTSVAENFLFLSTQSSKVVSSDVKDEAIYYKIEKNLSSHFDTDEFLSFTFLCL